LSRDRIDAGLLSRFEEGLNPLKPHESSIPARIIGYGEISTIFEILEPSQQGLAFKRLPIFETEDEMDSYESLFDRYNRILKEDIGIPVPRHWTLRVTPAQGNRVVYCIQEKMADGSVCNGLLHRLDHESILVLFRSVLHEMKKVWEYNRSQTLIEVALDSQLSNWALYCESLPGHLSSEDSRLVYLDTCTPLIRINGLEQLNTDLFLRSAPSFLVWFIKRFFLKDVVSRYYDPRMSVVDLIANLFKEQRPDLVQPFIAEANRFPGMRPAGREAEPITLREVRAYYRRDAFIWRLFLALRKLDRFLRVRVLNTPYPYILPGKIRR